MGRVVPRQTLVRACRTDIRLRADEVTGLHPDEWPFVHADDKPNVHRIMSALIEGKVPHNLSRNRNYNKQGAVLYCEWYNSCRTNAAGEMVSVMSLVHDVTDRHHAEEVLHRQQEELQRREAMLVESQRAGRVGSWRADVVSGEVEWSNETYRLLGVSPERFRPTRTSELSLIHPEDLARYLASREAAFSGEKQHDTVVRFVRPDNEIRYLHSRGEVEYGPDENPKYFVGTIRDVTEEQEAREHLQHYEQLVEASSDYVCVIDQDYYYRLTNRAYARLFNLERDKIEGRHVADIRGEAFFETEARSPIDRCLRGEVISFEAERNYPSVGKRKVLIRYYPIRSEDGVIRHVGSVTTDITDFKSVEEELRIGGNEFVVILPETTDETPQQRCGRVAGLFDRPLNVGPHQIEVSARFGYTVFGGWQRATQTLLHEAELALFESRSVARPGPRAFTRELEREVRTRIDLARELGHALEAGEFELHYQPKVCLATGELAGCEALLRWNHPWRGLVPPSVFIPVAERSQLIGPIGESVLAEACRQLRVWREDGLEVVRVAVNVSVVQFRLGNLTDHVHDSLAQYSVDPGSLTLEVTESMFAREPELLRSQMQALKKLGVHVALDDFGTGYSSLLYLQQYPFDEIKIDQGFVQKLIDDPYSRSIVMMVLRIAETIGAVPVAEGVESKDVRDELAKMGCSMAQGYYFSTPLAAEDFRWLLERRMPLPVSPSDEIDKP